MTPLADVRVWHASGGQLVRRGNGVAFVLGTSQPDASNTGFQMLGYTAATLQDYYGDYTVAGNGTVVQGLRIHGAVSISGNNCVVQGCEIVGSVPGSYNAAFRGLISNTGSNNVAQYNHLTQYDPSTNSDNSVFWREGLYLTGGSLMAYRNDIHDVNHLAYVTGGTHKIQGNYMHDPGFRTDDTDHASDAIHPNWSHNDGTHIRGGTGHLVEGNNYVMKFSTRTGMNSTANPSPTAEQIYPNAHGHLFQAANNVITGVTIRKNWYKYGAVGMHWTTCSFPGGGGDWSITGNRITPDQAKEFSTYKQLIIDPTSDWGTITVDATNVYSTDSDTPVAWQGQPLKAPTVSGTVKTWAYNSGAHTP